MSNFSSMDSKAKKELKKVKILGVIPARGGSKSVPFKNIGLLAGKPLIWYTIQTAKKSKLLDAFLVSTDSPKIAKIAKRFGADVPFLRPAKYSGDKSPDIGFLSHALEWVKKNRGWEPAFIVNLRPTSPFRTAEDIDEAIKLAIKQKNCLVKTVSPPSPHNPFKMWLFADKKTGRVKPLLPTKYYKKLGTDVARQLLPEAYWQNGLVDVIPATVIKKGRVFTKSVFAVVTDPKKSIDLDEPKDFIAAGKILKELKIII